MRDKRKEGELSIFHRSSRRRRRIVGRTSLDGGNKAGEKKRAESEKKVKGNGKRETRIQGGRGGGRKAEGLKSINFKSQSRRLTVITLVAGTFASRIRHQRRQRDLHSSSQCCWERGERETPKGEPRRKRKAPKVRGMPQKRLMLFDFRIRDKLRNGRGIVKPFHLSVTSSRVIA